MTDLKTCMGMESTKEALACAKDVVMNSKEECRPKLVLLVSEGCDYCREQEEIHKADISAGIIQRLDIASREGITVVEKNNLEFVPSLIVLDCHDNLLVA